MVPLVELEVEVEVVMDLVAEHKVAVDMVEVLGRVVAVVLAVVDMVEAQARLVVVVLGNPIN